jgi:hypothetical protein
MDGQQTNVPFIVHEADMTRMERSNHRLWILTIFLVICLIASNVAWFVYESQFEYYDEEIVTQDVTQHADGNSINRFIGGDYVGDSDSTNNND